MHTTVVIEVSPLGCDEFEARADGAVLCRSRAPLCAAARRLIELGHHPNSILTMRHRGSDTMAMRSTIGAAARVTAEDDKNGVPRFRKWRGDRPARGGAASPIRKTVKQSHRVILTPRRLGEAFTRVHGRP
jgi:hypothetical protein